jgi:basic amino acid/polyamine antiporter, APA family
MGAGKNIPVIARRVARHYDVGNRNGREQPMTTPSEGRQLERSMGLSSGIALVVGAVIGAGIFVLVREIGAQAGGAIWLAYAMAMLVSLIGVLPLINLAGALPRAGAGYLFTSRLISPGAGMMTSCWVLLGGCSANLVATLTLAEYVNKYLPFALPLQVTGLGLLTLFYIIYLFGLRLAMSLQVLMMFQFVLALALYAALGAWHNDLEFAFTSPLGSTSFLMAVLLSYSTCMGFQIVAEMGEEMRNARRNIPLALLIGGMITAAVYMVTGLVFVSSIPWDPETYRALETPLNASAETFMPPALVGFLSIAAITAGLTSLNAAATALPRECFAQARDRILPEILAKVSPRTGAPQHAITAYFIFVALLLMMGWSIDFYGYMAAIGILVMSSVLCIAALRLPKRYPEACRTAWIQFPRPLIWICTIITVLVSAGFAAVVFFEEPAVIWIYSGWSILVGIYYLARTRRFTAADRARFAVIPGEDEVLTRAPESAVD